MFWEDFGKRLEDLDCDFCRMDFGLDVGDGKRNLRPVLPGCSLQGSVFQEVIELFRGGLGGAATQLE